MKTKLLTAILACTLVVGLFNPPQARASFGTSSAELSWAYAYVFAYYAYLQDPYNTFDGTATLLTHIYDCYLHAAQISGHALTSDDFHNQNNFAVAKFYEDLAKQEVWDSLKFLIGVFYETGYFAEALATFEDVSLLRYAALYAYIGFVSDFYYAVYNY